MKMHKLIKASLSSPVLVFSPLSLHDTGAPEDLQPASRDSLKSHLKSVTNSEAGLARKRDAWHGVSVLLTRESEPSPESFEEIPPK